MITYIGIDPGLSGALAWLRPGGLSIIDMPTLTIGRGGKRKRELDPDALANLLRDDPGHAVIEDVHAMPGQGVSSVFSFGSTKGTIIGILAALQIPRSKVSPAVWKKALRVPADKDGARARASELFPASSHLWARVKDDGRAEAALIAEWGRRNVEG